MTAPLKVYTGTHDDDAEHFARLKRCKWGAWKFLLAGEWSASPFHQGRHRFYVASTRDRRYWALLTRGFPKRIIAVAQVETEVRLEKVAGEMLRIVKKRDGDYIDLVHSFGDIDVQQLWIAYTGQEDMPTLKAVLEALHRPMDKGQQ